MTSRAKVAIGLLAATTLIFCGASTNFGDPKEEEFVEPRSYSASIDNTGMVSAPVVYKNLMLIAVTSDGVAAVVFDEPIDHGVAYRFRYLDTRDKDAKEITGAGQVFERYVGDKYNGGKLTIKAGSIRIGWSRGDDKFGWVYYEPEKLQIQIAHAARFLDNDNGDIAPRGQVVPELDLHRYATRPR